MIKFCMSRIEVEWGKWGNKMGVWVLGQALEDDGLWPAAWTCKYILLGHICAHFSGVLSVAAFIL